MSDITPAQFAEAYATLASFFSLEMDIVNQDGEVETIDVNKGLVKTFANAIVWKLGEMHKFAVATHDDMARRARKALRENAGDEISEENLRKLGDQLERQEMRLALIEEAQRQAKFEYLTLTGEEYGSAKVTKLPVPASEQARRLADRLATSTRGTKVTENTRDVA